ncbi:MAG: 50S ribosomal protein L6 [Oscillospiraceae bacterium]
MSRIGNKPVAIPAGVEVKIDGSVVTVKGPKGTLTKEFNHLMEISQEGAEIIVKRPNDENLSKSLHGLTRTLIHNMVEGVTNGFSKELKINGVGYRCQKSGKDVTLTLGFSHPVVVSDSEDIVLQVPDPNTIIVTGIDKQKVGQIASEIRGKRPPEPYKGKGIKYADEVIRRKEGKAGKGKK